MQQQAPEFDLLSLWFEMRGEAKQPLVSPEVDQSHEGNKVDNAREEENEEDKEAGVEDTQEKIGEENTEVNLGLPPKFDEYEPDEGEMLPFESTWDDPKDEEGEQRENISHSKPTSQGMIWSLIIHGEHCAHNVSISKCNTPNP